MSIYQSTKIIELGSCAFRQWRATHSHCQYIHGYRLIAKYIFGCNALDDKNWAADFGGLKELKKILNNQFDHTFCVAQDDPLFKDFQHLNDIGAVQLRVMESVGIEKTAEWCFKRGDDFIRSLTGGRCWVESVEVFEHESNSALYIRSAITVTNQAATETPAPETSTAVVEETVTPSPEPQPQPVQEGPRGATVGSKVTTGWSNPFAGTSWGV